MTRTKAVDIVRLREIIQGLGSEQERIFLEKLSAEARDIYNRSVTTSWVPLKEDSEIMTVGAELLYPEDTHPLRRLGRQLAYANLTGIYKLFLRIPSPEFVLQRVAHMWKTYYDQGIARVEKKGERHLELVVEQCPDLIAPQRETTCGFIIGLGELAGVHNIQVHIIDQNHQAWRWSISWDAQGTPNRKP